jgi:hypothetical protein
MALHYFTNYRHDYAPLGSKMLLQQTIEDHYSLGETGSLTALIDVQENLFCKK